MVWKLHDDRVDIYPDEVAHEDLVEAISIRKKQVTSSETYKTNDRPFRNLLDC